MGKKDESEDTKNVNNEGDDSMSATINMERPCSIQESIIQSCKEVKLMREGKKKKTSWKSFSDELRKELKDSED